MRERPECRTASGHGRPGTLAAGGRQPGPLPLALPRTGAGHCRNAGRPATVRSQHPTVTHLVTAPARAAGPSSSRRAVCRRAKITVKSAPYGRVLRMALRATPDSDLPRQESGTYQEDGPLTRPRKGGSEAEPGLLLRDGDWHHVAMADIPPGGRPPGFESRSAMPPGRPPEPVEFTEEQQREIAHALHQAQIEVLRAIARSAARADRHYAARTAVRHLTQALATLRTASGQAQSQHPFFPGPAPWAGP